MKNIKKLLSISLVAFCIAFSCNEPITDFGYDGSISGTILDQSGNIVAGDITNSGFKVNALGENDHIPMELRVKGDGTFANNKLFPQSYTVWVEGPVVAPGEITIDLTGGKSVVHDFVVTPFLSIAPPKLQGNPTSSEIKVSFSISENEGHSVGLGELYCSTVPYPNASIGSGTAYETKKVLLLANQDTATITGLSSNTKYFIRIGARADGQNVFNYSDQIEVTTP
jgi:hypothetical protein